MEPGQTLSMIIDWKSLQKDNNSFSFFKSIHYGGQIGNTNKELSQLTLPSLNYELLTKKIQTQSPLIFKSEFEQEWDSNLNNLKKQIAVLKLSPKTNIIAKNIIDVDYGTYMFDYVMQHDYAKKMDSTNKVLKDTVPNSFYSFLNRFNFDDPSILIPSHFSTFINRFEYSTPFMNAMKIFYKKRKPGLTNNMELYTVMDSCVTAFYKINNNLVYQMSKLRTLSFTLKNRFQKDDSEKSIFISNFKKTFSIPFFQKETDIILQDNLNRENNIAHSIPSNKAGEIFKKIINPYKGKLLFVDFWATTCGPCVANIKNNFDTRIKYKDNKDFDFIFITSESDSPKKDYLKFVKDQQLTNTFYLKDDDYNYLRELFRFNAIPRYVTVDNKGDILNDNFEMHNFKYELSKLLPQYTKSLYSK